MNYSFTYSNSILTVEGVTDLISFDCNTCKVVADDTLLIIEMEELVVYTVDYAKSTIKLQGYLLGITTKQLEDGDEL